MAKKFQFSLQTVLRWREQAERLEVMRLGELEAERMRIQSKKEKLSEQLNAAIQQTETALSQGRAVDYEQMRNISLLQELLSIEEEHIVPLLKDVENRITVQRNILIQMSIEKRVVERLREKAWDEYLQERNREENLENDEINQLHFQRKMTEQRHIK